MNSKRRTGALGAALLAAAGIALLALWALSPIIVRVDGAALPTPVRALTVRQALASAGVALAPGDTVSPAENAWLLDGAGVDVRRAVSANIYQDGQLTPVVSFERRPANLLAQAGVRLFPGDRLLVNGRPASPDMLLQPGAHLLQLAAALPVTLSIDGSSQVLYSSAATLGQALWRAGFRLGPDDFLQPGPEAPLAGPLEADIRRAAPVNIQVDGQTLTTHSSAQTVGQALAEAGLPLQGMDYAVPAETEPLPADGQVRIVRVREDVLLEEKEIPFEVAYQPDPETELDQRSVMDPGQVGLVVTRVRVRYEDGQEVGRQAEGSWKARDPRARVLGYGTQVVVRTLETESGTIEYWRAVTMYATSFSPCNLAADHCGNITASGLPLKRGILGVKKAWYNVMAGQQAFIPGYGVGVIADYGAGVPGKLHIDLGFTDEDYEPWHKNTTVYFLTPVPANILYILQ